MVKTPTTSIPYNGSGTINIHINNPTASVGGTTPTYAPAYAMPYPMPIIYPMYYPYYCYPPNYYFNTNNNYNTHPTVQSGANAASNATATIPAQKIPLANDQNQSLYKNKMLSEISKTTTSEPNKKRQIVVLTDNYVKNLENYLKNPNAELRKTAAKEILQRFKEDKSRINNPSLTALLNIALQDTNATVRALAMSTLSAGYATGDKLTEQILKQIQGTKKAYSTDAIQASESLLKMSQTKALVPDNSHYLDQNNNTKKGK